MRISDWSSDVCSSDLNAIKYAVTPKEEGAEIVVQARLAGDRVQITVTDTGPGLRETKTRPSLSTGVGLANIRDRLAQAFGPDHRFETRSNRGGGFGVDIEIPFQLEEPTRGIGRKHVRT